MNRITAKHLSIVAGTLLAVLAIALWLWEFAAPGESMETPPGASRVDAPEIPATTPAIAARPPAAPPTTTPAPPAERDVADVPTEVESVEFAPDTAVALEGVVLDAVTGAPLAKAEVNVFARDVERPAEAATTDAAGRFRFAALARGESVVVKAWLPGFTRSARSIELHAAGTARVELRLAPCGVLRGVVRLPDGRGASGATVRVVPAAGGAEAWDGAFAETGADGSYAVRTAPVGAALTVAATARGFAASASEAARVPADGRDAVCDLTLRRAATLVVSVIGPSNQHPNAKVWVDDVRESAGRSVRYDPKAPDRFTTVHAGLAPGPHTVHVEPSRFAATTREIALAEGERAMREIRLVDGVTIEGTVADDAGTPVARVAVFALPADFEHPRRRMAATSRSGISGADGRFRIVGIAPGSYDLYVLGAHETGIETPEIDPARTAVVAPSKDVRIVVPRETRIVLRVVLPEGVKRPAGVLVTQETGDGMSPNRTDDRSRAIAIDAAAWTADGVVRCGFPAGATWLRVSVPDFAPELVRVPQWELGRVVDLGEIELDAGTELRGSVVDSDGRPLAGATVTTSASAAVRTKDDGTFVVEHLALGAVVVRATAEGRYGGRYVGEVGVAGPVVVRARRLGRLSGVVVDAKGATVAGARVVFDRGTAHRYLDRGGIENFVLAELADAVTGDDGAFAVDVPYGPCKGRVGTAAFEADVPEGGEARVRVVTR